EAPEPGRGDKRGLVGSRTLLLELDHPVAGIERLDYFVQRALQRRPKRAIGHVPEPDPDDLGPRPAPSCRGGEVSVLADQNGPVLDRIGPDAGIVSSAETDSID